MVSATFFEYGTSNVEDFVIILLRHLSPLHGSHMQSVILCDSLRLCVSLETIDICGSFALNPWLSFGSRVAIISVFHPPTAKNALW